MTWIFTRGLVNVHFSIRWLNPLFRIGYKRRLEEDDMYPVLPEDGSETLGLELNRYRDVLLCLCTWPLVRNFM